MLMAKPSGLPVKKAGGEKPLHHLNAMYEGESTGVKLERIGEKENEISALPGFLGRFNLKDTRDCPIAKMIIIDLNNLR